MDLIEYVKDDKGKLIGCVAAVDKDKLGWSICHTLDGFNKKRGRTIAIERAKKDILSKSNYKNLDNHLNLLIDVSRKEPTYKTHFVMKALRKLRVRAIKYFKD
jgi:hypothetical protein